MPLVRLSMRKGKSREEIKAVSDAVHDALVAAFQIPVDDRNQRIIEYARDDYELPPDKTDMFTLIELTVFAGRSLATKKKLYVEINRRLEALGFHNPKDIVIVMTEVPLDNWGVLGGVPASSIRLPFSLDI